MFNLKDIFITKIDLGQVASFLLESGDGIALVDTGYKGDYKKIMKFLKEMGISPKDIDIIVITHAHSDHAGSLAKIAEKAEADVICQKDEADFLINGRNSSLASKNMFINMMRVFFDKNFESCPPDIVFENELDLNKYGLPAKLIHTPGHTHGSLTVVFDDKKRAISGDLVMKLFGLRLTPITYDREVLKKSVKRLLDMGIQEFYISHGGKIQRENIEKLVG